MKDNKFIKKFLIIIYNIYIVRKSQNFSYVLFVQKFLREELLELEIKVGTDIIEISRIKKSIEDTDNKFIERVFTNKEIIYCESRKLQKYQHYAVRFAGKEAVFKAISNLLKNKFDIDWKDIEILNDSEGRPYVNILNSKIDNIINIDISLSHCKEYAIANVIVYLY